MSGFSQNISKPRILKDSTGLTLFAFNETQVNIIIKSLKENGVNKKVINELENKINLMKEDIFLLNSVNDTLNSKNKKILEIKINLQQEVSIQKKIIDNLNKNNTDYELKVSELNTKIIEYVDKIKRKNRWITKLVISNVITATILVLVLL